MDVKPKTPGENTRSTSRRRILVWLSVSFLIAAVAVVTAVLWERARPQIVTVDGRQYIFAGVDYGTKHIQPTWRARLLDRAPTSVSNYVQRVLGKRLGPITSFQTTEPSLCVWFRGLGPEVPAMSANGILAMLADENGALAGNRNVFGSFMGRFPWSHSTFQLVPRRARVLEVRLLTSVEHEVGRFHFANPVFRPLPAMAARSPSCGEKIWRLGSALGRVQGRRLSGTSVHRIPRWLAPGCAELV